MRAQNDPEVLRASHEEPRQFWESHLRKKTYLVGASHSDKATMKRGKLRASRSQRCKRETQIGGMWAGWMGAVLRRAVGQKS